MTAGAAEQNVEYGDREVVLSGTILRSIVGSEVYGTALPGSGDRDEMGVYIDRPERVLGLGEYRQSYVARTQPEGARSGPGDIDLTMYSLREYLRLAVKGNPTALLPLFAPEAQVIAVTELGHELRQMRHRFLSQQAVERFLGYMHSQHERMLGQSKRNVPNRPELIAKFGWDVKYGGHALRLAYQGMEIAAFGTLSLPMEESERQRVLAVRRGEISRDEVSTMITAIEARVRRLLDEGRTPLPKQADLNEIGAWAVSAQRRHWGWAR